MTLYKIFKKKRIGSFTDCLCTDLSWWSFAEPVHLYWEVDTFRAAWSVSSDVLFPNIKRNKKSCMWMKRMEEKKNDAWFSTEDIFFKDNSYSALSEGHSSEKWYFAACYVTLFLTLSFLSLNSKHCNTT